MNDPRSFLRNINIGEQLRLRREIIRLESREKQVTDAWLRAVRKSILLLALLVWAIGILCCYIVLSNENIIRFLHL